MESDGLNDWSYIKYNVTDCATDCPTGLDLATGSVLAVCEEASRQCFCVSGYYFEDSSQTKCIHIYTNLIWPYVVHYAVPVSTLLMYIVALVRLTQYKVNQHIQKRTNRNGKKHVVTFPEKLRVCLYGNYVIRSLNIIILYAVLKLVRECLIFYIPIRWEQSLNTCVYLMCVAFVNLFVQFSRLTSKMIGQKSQQQKEEGCGKITIGKTPLVKVLRRIFYTVVFVCLVLANVTIFDKNIPELYRSAFTQYIIGVFMLVLSPVVVYFGCKYSIVS